MSDDKSRQEEKKSKETFNRQDDKWWVLGLFYYNKGDHMIFIRRGAGVRLNYGHKAVQIWIAVIIISFAAFGVIMELGRR